MTTGFVFSIFVRKQGQAGEYAVFYCLNRFGETLPTS
jgi:hypothetical protein